MAPAEPTSPQATPAIGPAGMLEANRELWNQKKPVHAASAFYGLAAFKGGKSSLNAIELEEVGEVRGKSLLHLQCHFGQDNLSWARLEAEATGVDFSEEAVRLGQGLRLEFLHEFPFSPYNCFNNLEQREGGNWRVKHLPDKLPMLFSLKAVK